MPPTPNTTSNRKGIIMLVVLLFVFGVLNIAYTTISRYGKTKIIITVLPKPEINDAAVHFQSDLAHPPQIIERVLPHFRIDAGYAALAI